MKNLKDCLEVLHVDLNLSTADEVVSAARVVMIAQSLRSADIDTLTACFEKGPVFDGDVPSKQSRDQLVSFGALAKVVVKGEEGYNACTYYGAQIYRVVKFLKS